MIRDDIKAAQVAAMKAGDKARLGTIRLMLAKIKDRQWALADIDWDAPGAETITDEMRPKLKAFMADLCWIENVGARGFAAMAKKAPTPTIAEIYRYFHAEEQRHANAELALMKRWGMLDDGEMPEPNVNIRLAIDWLDTYADDMSLSILGTVIPMLEVALDGALLKVSQMHLDGEITREQAITLVQKYKLVPRDAAEQSLEFDKQYRSYVINYSVGEDLVRNYVDRMGGSDPKARWAAYEHILATPTLPSDLR